MWRVLSHIRKEELGSSSIVFEDVIAHKEVIIKSHGNYFDQNRELLVTKYKITKIPERFVGTETIYASVLIREGTGNFEVILREQKDSEDFDVILTGQIYANTEDDASAQLLSQPAYRKLMTKSQLYDTFKDAGHQLGEEFCLVQDLYRCALGLRENFCATRR